MASVAREAGIAYSTAQRWVGLFRAPGLGALARKPRSDRGERRALSPKLLEAVEGLALQKPPVPITTLYRQICRIAQDNGELVPSYKTVYRIIRNLPKDLMTLAHKGTRVYSNVFDLIHRREVERPN